MGVIALDCDDLFATWRDQARVLLGHGIDPSEVTWSQGPMADLLAIPTAPPEGPGPFRAKVPAALLSQLEQASRYRGEEPAVRSALARRPWRPHSHAGG